jgi:cell division protease FtsH
MTLTDDELIEPNVDTGEDRRPITDVATWFADLNGGVRPALRALGELLIGVAERDTQKTRSVSRPAAWV